MRHILHAAALAAAVILASAQPVLAQTAADDDRFNAAQQRFDRELAIYKSEVERYQAARDRPYEDGGDDRYREQRYDEPSENEDDRDEGSYDPSSYYRDGANYEERTLAPEDRVYRGSDGRYYCRRSDGTTGLIVGAAAGGIFGNVIDGGHSRAAGTLIGGAIGALAGRAVEQNSNSIRCR
jgi:hypothetical protein